MKQLDSLDQLKESWKLLSADTLKKELSVHEIEKIIRQKSKSELDKIKRKLFIETIISFSFLPFIIIYMHKIITSSIWILDIYLVIIFLAFGIPALRLFKTGKFKNQETKVFLAKFIFRFEQSIKTTLILSAILIPLGGIIGGVMGFLAGLRGDPKPVSDYGIFLRHHFNSPSELLIVSIIVLVLVILSTLFFIKVYYVLMYSKHIKNMKNFLQELNKIEKPEINFDDGEN